MNNLEKIRRSFDHLVNYNWRNREAGDPESKSKWYHDMFRIQRFWDQVIEIALDDPTLGWRQLCNFVPRASSDKYREANLLLIACVTERWEIFSLMLHPESNLNACFHNSSYRRRNVLTWLIQKNQVALFHKALTQCNGNLYSVFTRKGYVTSPFSYISQLLKWEFLPSDYVVDIEKANEKWYVRYALVHTKCLSKLQPRHYKHLLEYFQYDCFRLVKGNSMHVEDIFKLVLTHCPEVFEHLGDLGYISNKLRKNRLFKQVLFFSGRCLHSEEYPFSQDMGQYCAALAEFPFPLELHLQILCSSKLFSPEIPLSIVCGYFVNFIPETYDHSQEWEMKSKKLVALKVYNFHLRKSFDDALESGNPFQVTNLHRYTILNMVFRELNKIEGWLNRDARADVEVLLCSLPLLNRQSIQNVLS